MFNFDPIGHIRSDFTEKFGIPRQPGITPSLDGAIVLERTRFNEEALRDLEGYSHIWIIFVFHDLKKSPDKARIRPPRLGGNKYVGVFSSRSPYRPNPIGLSLVKLDEIVIGKEHIEVRIFDHDLLNDTPVIDIKPFISNDVPISEPLFGWQQKEWNSLEVSFSERALAVVQNNTKLHNKIFDILKNDPRPAYKKNKASSHGFTFGEYNITFSVKDNHCLVEDISLSKEDK